MVPEMLMQVCFFFFRLNRGGRRWPPSLDEDFAPDCRQLAATTPAGATGKAFFQRIQPTHENVRQVT